MTELVRSYGGSFQEFRIHRYEGEVELEALPAGLVVTVRDDLKEVAAIQIIPWPQVAAWMEAATAADTDPEQLIQSVWPMSPRGRVVAPSDDVKGNQAR